MRCVDVNVLVDAFRADSPDHASVRVWLDEVRRGPQPLVLLPEVASGFLRIVTNQRIWRTPSSPDEALHFLSVLADSPAVELRHAGGRHWVNFTEMVEKFGLTGNDVPDAYLVSAATSLGAVFVTSDRGFARYPGLPVERPAASASPA